MRVIMELMPEAEGEIGSIASVSFRADATMRSVATKPQLAIDCPAPKSVRIGGDMPVTLTLSNPGTGAATGVVLEGYLPDTVSHRSGSELEFDVGQLRPGETRTISLVNSGTAAARSVEMVVMPVDAGEQRITVAARSTDGPSAQVAHACQVEGLAAVSYHVDGGRKWRRWAVENDSAWWC